MTNHGRGSRKSHRQPLPFEARLRIFCTIAALCTLGLSAAVLELLHASTGTLLSVLAVLLLFLLIAFTAFIEAAIRPIQTLANVVAALREEDYSFRARGATRDDALGQLSLEINALADTLQAQRVASLEAVALLRRVIAEMDAPILAFDQDSRLRLLNPAAERVFSLVPARDLGQRTAELDLSSLLEQPSDTVLQLECRTLSLPGNRRPEQSTQSTRWMIRRSSFRQRGVPHTLVVLSDVSAALREEERLAWRRLIRVIGHEISNSLTPIKSIAGSLRSRLHPTTPLPEQASVGASLGRTNGNLDRDLNKGLSVIENRADSLNRFVQAYRQLAQLPAPVLRSVPLLPLLERVVSLEIRMDVRILSEPDVALLADPDQMEQLLINLIRNAVEAATSCIEEARERDSGAGPPSAVWAREARGLATVSSAPASGLSELRYDQTKEPGAPEVTIRAHEADEFVSIQIEDNGPGIANPENLFVPLYTTKKSGSGVGLALARQIVEAHGGAITLRNRAGTHGCIAEVRLPLAESTRAQPFSAS